MIEKLDKFDSTEASIYHVEKLYAKVNEIIDTVNELQKDYENVCVWISDIQKLKTPTVNVQDKFAEQRKWIGKLCKLWDNRCEGYIYAILTGISDTARYPYLTKDGYCYGYCEPVSEDLIYKGE